MLTNTSNQGLPAASVTHSNQDIALETKNLYRAIVGKMVVNDISVQVKQGEVLAILGLALDDSFTRLNALKQILSFSINMPAAIFSLFSGQVIWSIALVIALSALIGGVLGGRLAGWIRPIVLRWIVVSTGVVIAVLYFV